MCDSLCFGFLTSSFFIGSTLTSNTSMEDKSGSESSSGFDESSFIEFEGYVKISHSTTTPNVGTNFATDNIDEVVNSSPSDRPTEFVLFFDEGKEGFIPPNQSDDPKFVPSNDTAKKVLKMANFFGGKSTTKSTTNFPSIFKPNNLPIMTLLIIFDGFSTTFKGKNLFVFFGYFW